MQKITYTCHPHDIGWVRSVMLFPNDEVLRNQNYAVEVLKYESQTSRELSEKWLSTENNLLKIGINSEVIDLIINAPSDIELRSIRAQNTKQAYVAGQILAALYLMDKFQLPEPSMNKAIFYAAEYAKKNKYGDRSAMHGESKIKKYWKEFMPVSHLWAAKVINQDFKIISEEDFFSEQGFHSFLRIASVLYDFGTTFIPFRARPRVPVLSVEKCWFIDNIGSSDLNLNISPIKLKKILKKYKAPKTAPILD